MEADENLCGKGDRVVMKKMGAKNTTHLIAPFSRYNDGTLPLHKGERKKCKQCRTTIPARTEKELRIYRRISDNKAPCLGAADALNEMLPCGNIGRQKSVQSIQLRG